MAKLWNFLDSPINDNPSRLIYESAERLSIETDQQIEGFVTETTRNEMPEVTFGFYLVVPRLKNYSYRLFQFEFKSLIDPYPITGIQFANDVKNNLHFESNSYAEFETNFKSHISNSITKSILSAIKAHIDIVNQYKE